LAAEERKGGREERGKAVFWYHSIKSFPDMGIVRKGGGGGGGRKKFYLFFSSNSPIR